MKWCRVNNENFVIEVFDTDPANLFHPDIKWFECPDETVQGWYKDGVTVREETDTDKYPVLSTLKEYAEKLISIEADRRIELAQLAPAIGIDYTGDPKKKDRANAKRDNMAKINKNLSDSDDNLFDHIDQIYDSVDTLHDTVEACSDDICVNNIISTIADDINWPIWTPIA